MENHKNEITRIELYAIFGMNYNEISNKRKPIYWTQEVFIIELKKTKDNGESTNATHLSQSKKNQKLYRALMYNVNKKYINLEVVLKKAEIPFEDFKRTKKYKNDESIVIGMIKIIGSSDYQKVVNADIKLSNLVKVVDNMLYLAVLGKGHGDFDRGLLELGINLPGRVPMKNYSFDLETRKNISKMFGDVFENLIYKIFECTPKKDKNHKINSTNINGKIPDMIDINNSKNWLEIKLTSNAVNLSMKEDNPYHDVAENLIYVYLTKTNEFTKIPENVKIVTAYSLINKVRNKDKNILLGELRLLDEITKRVLKVKKMNE